MKRIAALALASIAPLTSGCIAAAIPLAAGVGVLHAKDTRRATLPPVPAPTRPLASASSSDKSDLALVQTSLTELPPPSPAQERSSPAVAAFGSYALRVAQPVPGAARRESALLSSASDLRPSRIACGARPIAVFLDLDPGRASFDPLAPGAPNKELATVLAALRENGIKVVWFSRLGENFAGPARAALAAGALDPQGTDTLILMRDIGERKQTRRDEVAARWCPVAMLGDERADFDELYLYLKDPDAAFPLDVMLGKGWFLVSPFAASPPSGATP